jgi:hypothetical protein
MKSNGWDIDTKWLDDIAADVKKGAQKICEDAAAQALKAAADAAPVDEGALQKSGYIISKTKPRGNYKEAVDAAKAASGTRLEKRGQVEPILAVPSTRSAWAALHFPLTYADLVRFGYYNVKSKSQIPGRDFLQTGENATDIESAARAVLRDVMSKHGK